MIYELIQKFVDDNREDNEFVRRVLLEDHVYWNEPTDAVIVRGIYDALTYGAGLDDEEMRVLFDRYRSDIIDYLEDFIDRTGYSDFFTADAEEPLYRFVMTTILDDLVYCLGWYIVEQLEQEDYPELQDADCLETGLLELIRILEQEQKQSYFRNLQEDMTEYLEHITGLDQFDL